MQVHGIIPRNLGRPRWTEIKNLLESCDFAHACFVGQGDYGDPVKFKFLDAANREMAVLERWSSYLESKSTHQLEAEFRAAVQGPSGRADQV